MYLWGYLRDLRIKTSDFSWNVGFCSFGLLRVTIQGLTFFGGPWPPRTLLWIFLVVLRCREHEKPEPLDNFRSRRFHFRSRRFHFRSRRFHFWSILTQWLHRLYFCSWSGCIKVTYWCIKNGSWLVEPWWSHCIIIKSSWMQTEWKFYMGHRFSMFHPSQHNFFHFDKRVLSGHELSKKVRPWKVTVSRSNEQRRIWQKNLTFLFCDLLLKKTSTCTLYFHCGRKF